MLISAGQAQLALHHPNEALSSALRAYELCHRSSQQTASAFPISAFVVKCKKAKWDLRERDRLRRRDELLADLVQKLETERKMELDGLSYRAAKGEIGDVTHQEESAAVDESYVEKINELRNVFAIAHPDNLSIRVRPHLAFCYIGYTKKLQEIPSYLIDDISFEIMHDPVVTKHGHSYERATIVEHLKRNPTVRTPRNQ
jgi:STIP1 homology and U-box containing protein 1